MGDERNSMNSIAEGESSIAEGKSCIAEGKSCIAEGNSIADSIRVIAKEPENSDSRNSSLEEGRGCRFKISDADGSTQGASPGKSPACSKGSPRKSRSAKWSYNMRKASTNVIDDEEARTRGNSPDCVVAKKRGLTSEERTRSDFAISSPSRDGNTRYSRGVPDSKDKNMSNTGKTGMIGATSKDESKERDAKDTAKKGPIRYLMNVLKPISSSVAHSGDQNLTPLYDESMSPVRKGSKKYETAINVDSGNRVESGNRDYGASCGRSSDDFSSPEDDAYSPSKINQYNDSVTLMSASSTSSKKRAGFQGSISRSGSSSRYNLGGEREENVKVPRNQINLNLSIEAGESKLAMQARLDEKKILISDFNALFNQSWRKPNKAWRKAYRKRQGQQHGGAKKGGASEGDEKSPRTDGPTIGECCGSGLLFASKLVNKQKAPDFIQRYPSYSNNRWSNNNCVDWLCQNIPIIHPENSKRVLWQMLMTVPLMYIGTILPYRITFVDFRILPTNTFLFDSLPIVNEFNEDRVVWDVIDAIVDIMFWLDLMQNFFVAYIDLHGHLHADPRDICKSYLTGWFLIDLIACLPQGFWELFISNLNKTNKVGRLPQLYRLSRLTRLGKLINLRKFFKENRLDANPLVYLIMQTLARSRLANVLKFLVVLLFISHLLGCVWYLIASLDEDPYTTWVARRSIGITTWNPTTQQPENKTLWFIEMTPFSQWFTCLYFIVTVCTTVGFGDITPFKNSEVIFVVFLMLFGAVVNSIIVSEVIGILTRVDLANEEFAKKKQSIQSYFERVKIEDRISGQLQTKMNKIAENINRAKHCPPTDSDKKIGEEAEEKRHQRESDANIRDDVDTTSFDFTSFWETCLSCPPALQRLLASKSFDGKLIQNLFLTHAKVGGENSQNGVLLSLMMSSLIVKRTLRKGYVLYRTGEQPSALYLIVSGTVSYTAVPSEMGGIEHVETIENVVALAEGFSVKRYPYMIMSNGNYAGELELVNPYFNPASIPPPGNQETESVLGVGLGPGAKSSRHHNSSSTHSTGGWRKSTLRVESDTAEILVLSRKNFIMLCHSFPHLLENLRKQASRREHRRMKYFRQHTQKGDHHCCAVAILQNFFRERRRRKLREKLQRAQKKIVAMSALTFGAKSKRCEEERAEIMERRRQKKAEQDLIERKKLDPVVLATESRDMVSELITDMDKIKNSQREMTKMLEQLYFRSFAS